MPRRIPSIALIIALCFQALFVVPAAIAGCCCEAQGMAATSNEDCSRQAATSDHRSPCCNAGAALACGGACAAIALPVMTASLTASLVPDSIEAPAPRVPSSQHYSPLKPPPIA